ncbi:MAG: prolyl-tRNA synthetase [Parcubacteria group bacterium Gr01-1014_3]|nr:MAG: prolyl-tRNA synthetase [Parcubacteria group bacterium Gr01-1014_3]
MMLQSRLFTKTLKSFPKDEEAINAKMLIRGGFIRKMSAGVYAQLPLGLRVLDKINRIIREEMNAIGGQEMLMQALVAKEYWEKSKRWHTDVAYEFKSPFGEEFALGWTHEEVVTAIATHFINSYKDLPLSVYQIQTKYRAEPRAKNGLLRGREFMMKDLYSFHSSKESLDDFYQQVIKAYQKILKRVGLKALVTEASGGAFTKEYTHEFQVLAPAGEDVVFYCKQCDFAQNKEIAHVQKGNICPLCGGEIGSSPAIEVANVFKLGTRYSEAFNLTYTDKDGNRQPVIMGSYGIGPTRIMATLVEVHNDEKGIIWPESVAPYQIHLLELKSKNGALKLNAKKIYKDLKDSGIEVLFDDRDVSAGEKFADADLLGIPWRAVISEKSGAKIELKKRDSKEAKLVGLQELQKLTNN